MHLTDDMKRVVTEQRLGFYATVCADGTPNLSPKGTTFVYDDASLAFLELRSPGTMANLVERPVVEVNVLDVLTRTGYRFKGEASIHRDGDVFDRALAIARAIDFGIDLGRVGAVVRVLVTSADPLTSPAYDEGATQVELVEHYRDRFARLAEERLRSGDERG